MAQKIKTMFDFILNNEGVLTEIWFCVSIFAVLIGLLLEVFYYIFNVDDKYQYVITRVYIVFATIWFFLILVIQGVDWYDQLKF